MLPIGSERHGSPIQRNQRWAPLDGQVLFHLSNDLLFEEQSAAYKRQKQVADINTKNAELQKEILIRDYSSGVVKQYEAYLNNLHQVEAERKNYQLAQQLLDLVLQRFQLRVATIIDVRVAQQTLEDAGYRLINVSYAAKAAEIELKRLSNTLTF